MKQSIDLELFPKRFGAELKSAPLQTRSRRLQRNTDTIRRSDMPPNDFPEMIAAMACFGLIVVCPLVMLLLKHQRQMAELMHRGPDDNSLQRIEALEHEVRNLRAAQNEFVLQSEDKKGLGPGDTN